MVARLDTSQELQVVVVVVDRSLTLNELPEFRGKVTGAGESALVHPRAPPEAPRRTAGEFSHAETWQRRFTTYGALSLQTKRIQIIPALHGKLTRDGKLSEPDVYFILEKWLKRHPTLKGRENEIRIVRGRWTQREGIRTEVISVSAIENDEIAGYDPAEDRDLYEYYLAEERYYQEL